MTDTSQIVWERHPERRVPDAVVMEVPGISAMEARLIAKEACEHARRMAPKLSGASARRFLPYFGEGFFGIRWLESYVWFQEMGVRAFTMRSLAGRTVPMWISDPTGRERRKYPRARTRVTASGTIQVLIFRRAARIGEQKQRVDPRTGQVRWVPRSYPGAPGRIVMREALQPWTSPGRRPGAIARTNVGVRWRFPGLDPRGFLHQGIMEACYSHGLAPGPVVAVHMAEFNRTQRRRSA